jgi:4-hydroxy-3-methylbut-2-enyl diphosphate reductase
MKIILARTAGFCMGVRRAMELAVDAAGECPAPVRTQGPLIHNRHAVELLESRGVSVLTKTETPSDGTVILRAHGVSPREREELAACGAKLVDATCPHVLLSQKRIAEETGREVVLVGDPEHPEVKALAGAAKTMVYLISDLEGAERVRPEKDFIVIAQTTFNRRLYEEMAAILQKRFPGCKIFDSICNATESRQEEARELARKVDAMVVVGGLHSANSRRLAEVAREEGCPALHVEQADDLDPDFFARAKTVGVTAGASTPGWMTQQVIDRLESLGTPGLAWYLRRILRGAARARLVTAAGAACLCLAMSEFMGMGVARWDVTLMVSAFFFTAYSLNRREPPEETRGIVHVDAFYHQHRRAIWIGALAGFFLNISLAWKLGYEMAALIGTANIFAVLYAVPFLPKSFRFRRLKDFPASKDLLVAAAWACVLVGALALSAEKFPTLRNLAGSGGIVFLLIFAKTVMLDLRDIEGDHLIGLETVPVLIGKARAVRLLYLIHLFLFGLILFLGASGIVVSFGLLLALVPLYGAGALSLLARSRFQGEAHCQLVINGQLLLCGALAIAWRCGLSL